MSEHDARPTTGTAVPAQVLWPEQWYFSRTPAPGNRFWDPRTAGWRSGPAVPSPRSGD